MNQIEYEFDQLQRELDESLAVREEQTRQTLLNSMDRDVIALLKFRRDSSQDFLDRYEQVLLDLAKAELVNISVDRNHFIYQGERYDLSWEQVEQNDSQFFRLHTNELKLAWDLVHQAKERKPENGPLPPAQLLFHYDGSTEGQYAALKQHIGASGLLQVEKLTFHYAGTSEEHLLVVGNRIDGHLLSPDDVEKLLRIPAEASPIGTLDSSSLDEIMTVQRESKALETSEKLEQYFEQESSKLERWADDRRQALQLTINELDREIKELKRSSRQLPSLQEKLTAKTADKKSGSGERGQGDGLSITTPKKRSNSRRISCWMRSRPGWN